MAKLLTEAQPPPSRMAGLQDLGVPVAVLAIVLIMITPIPPFLLDIMISANIMLSVVVLLVSLYIKKAVEFSVFPTTLLLLTLFRLALNISSSRAILLNGNSGTSAAGEVIEAFGNFVVGGNYVIGVVIFLVLLAIQFVVINHGAVRISEVTARFTLDAMPGKQMSIDSDLNAGLIDETQARTRRKEIASEAEFYGAMDGATRFTQRDAIASILITVINIVAGFLIGVLQHGMDLKKALETYTVLTIGDGLVTVIPALVISVSGGLIVTRTGSSESRLAETFRKQVLGDSQPLLLASGVLLLLAVLPGMPKLPFLLMGGGVGWIGWRMRQKVGAAARQVAAAEPHAPAKENLDLLLKVEPLAVEVGLGLVGMVEGGANSPLLRRIAGIRKQLAGELGYMLPAVRVTDNLALGAREYDIRLKGVEIARFELKQGCELAIRPSGDSGAMAIEGTATMEPAFGIPAVWVRSEHAEKARSEGYTVVDASNVIGTHLMELIRRHAHELFSRQDAKKFLDRVAEENPKIVEDLVPKLLSLAVLQRVLQNLLRERVSIRDAVSILEALGEAGNVTRNPVLLTEYVRQALGRSIVQPYLGPKGDLPAYFLDSSVEQAIESSVEHGEHSSQMNLAPQKIRDILDRVSKRVPNVDGPVVAVASTGARYFLRQLLEPSFRNVFVLSHSEIPAGTKVTSLGLI
jgi:flagellar biosynthesis protein FlhA